MSKQTAAKTANERSTFEPGARVTIVLPDDHSLYTTRWYPRGVVTGVVQRTFKNGNVAVAVDQMSNRSADGKHTLHFAAENVIAETSSEQCHSCELTAKRDRGEQLTSSESSHVMMWGCTCDPEDEAAAIAYVDAVTR